MRKKNLRDSRKGDSRGTLFIIDALNSHDAAMRQAELIFQLGEKLPEAVRDAIGAPSVRLAVGISEGLSKLAVRRGVGGASAEVVVTLVWLETDCRPSAYTAVRR